MATVAEIQAQINDLNNKISKLSSGLSGAGQRTTYQNQIKNLQPQLAAAQKAEAQQAQPQQQATSIAQVAPQSSSVSNSQFPTLNQSIIDSQFANKRTNELTANNSDIRDQIYNAGWNQKSDAVKVLNGAGVYGIVSGPQGMGGIGYKTPDGKVASDQDFINAAKAAGIDPNQYQKTQTGGLGSIGAKVLDKEAIYNVLQEKGKDLYSVTNALTGAERGDSAPHATVLYKSDGNGNLVVQNNAETGQPDVKYFDATRYAEAPSFMDTYGPFLSLAPAFGGILQANGVIPSFGNAGTAADASLGFNVSQVAPTSAAAQAAGIGGGFSGATAGNITAALTSGNVVGSPSSWAAANEAAGLGTSAAGTLGPGVASTIGGAALGAGGAAGGNAIANAINAGTIASGVGSVLGAGAAYSGAQMQADAAKQAAANQMSMFNTINNQLQPQRGAGYQSLNQIRSMLPGQYTTYDETGKPVGTAQGTDYLTRQFTPQDLQAGLAPNYQFMLGQGQQQTQRQANLAGGAMGGNALRALQDYTQNYAGNAYQNAFQNFNTQRTGIYNTLAGIAGIGQNATNTSAQAGQAATTAAGQLGVGSAAAQAAGLTGAANALQGGVQNYQQNQILQAILGQNQNVAQQSTATPNFNVA